MSPNARVYFVHVDMTDEQRAANRARFPETAKVMDEYRAAFGGFRLIWAEEDGVVIRAKKETCE